MTLNKSLLGALYDILTRKSIDDFLEFAGVIYKHPTDEDRRCLYIRGSENSKVLAVGHLDHVMFTHSPKMTADGTKIKAPQLDDRLGIWVIMAVLHQHLPKDMPYDILLTDKEEIGQSTGILFTPPENHQYNWIFEWDRRGDDVVMYDYETKALCENLESHGFKVGKGSFSDIGVMDRLGCAAFNFGTCYYQEHSTNCWGDIPQLVGQLKKFKKFYEANYNTHLIGDQEEATKARGRKTSYLYSYVKKTYVDSSPNKIILGSKEGGTSDKVLPFLGRAISTP